MPEHLANRFPTFEKPLPSGEPRQNLIQDIFGRPLASLRLSVTDRCNLRCLYCMPEEEYVWLPREQLLSFEELAELVSVFVDLGVSRIRLTGGEPLLRNELDRLVAMLAADTRIGDLAMTTNGVLLADHAEALRKAGLGRLTVSLDTLRPERFRAITRRDEHHRVLAGLAAANAVGFTGTKIDAVIVRGSNDDELEDLIEFGRGSGAEVRFIEYMDVGGATHWRMDRVVSRDEILAQLARRYGKIAPIGEDGPAPAKRFMLPDGTVFGIIASTTEPFCRSCDRSRITADGIWYRCLYATSGSDLRRLLRSGASRASVIAQIGEEISSAWRAREDRGAELRIAEPGHARGAFISVDELRRNPHLEMHTRGG